MKQFLYRTAFAMHFRESLFDLPGNFKIFVANLCILSKLHVQNKLFYKEWLALLQADEFLCSIECSKEEVRVERNSSLIISYKKCK